MIKKYQETNKLPGVVGNVKDSSLKKPYQVIAVPSAYLIDGKGIIRDAWLGPKLTKTLKKNVSPYLKD